MAGCGVNDVHHLYIGRRLTIAQLLLLLLLWMLFLLLLVFLLCNGVDLAKGNDTPGALGVSHGPTLGR